MNVNLLGKNDLEFLDLKLGRELTDVEKRLVEIIEEIEDNTITIDESEKRCDSTWEDGHNEGVVTFARSLSVDIADVIQTAVDEVLV